MKGLLIKDFKLLLLQKNFFFLILAAVAGMMIFTDDIIFPLGFFSFISALFTLSTLSYDDLDNGRAFLFTLPISRKSYVLEKYSLGLILGGGTWIFATAFAMITSLVKGTLVLTDLLMSALIILSIIILLQAIMLPFQLKFGSDIGRIAIFGTFIALMVVSFIIASIAKGIFHIDLIQQFNALPPAPLGLLVLMALVAALALLLASLKISIFIINKKEF